MKSVTNTEHEILDVFESRWSPRDFAQREVEPEALQKLFEAARWAPSSYNEQPRHFIVTTQEQQEDFDRLLECLSTGNAKWAKKAPVLILSVAKLNFDKNNTPNRHAFHDVGLAVGNLIAQATALGIYVHQMAGFDSAKARAVFEIPEGFAPVAVIALGYLSKEAKASKMDKASSRSRRPFTQFVFSKRFGNPAGLVNI